MARQHRRHADGQVHTWKLLAEQAPQVLSATTFDEVLERGLHFACSLGEGDLALSHWRNSPGDGCQSLAIARGRELTRFHRSTELSCAHLLSLFSETDAIVIEDPQLRRMQKMLPQGCRSLILKLKVGNEVMGALQLITIVESTCLFSRVEALRSFAKMFAHMLSLKQEAARLQAAVDRLTLKAQESAEANQAKTAFLANISHEIRTPLGVILGFADLALDARGLTKDTRGYISAIRRNAEQVTEILGEVLDLSKIEASRLEIEEIRFPLLPMLNEVITFLDLHAREKGLSLSLQRIGPLPKVVKTDPTRLRQILSNLIGNAIKFTEKGHVTLSVRMISPPKAGTPVQLEFSVADTGIGIPSELKEKLFQPFMQLELSTSRRFGGTGLGLTLSKQLVQALGGDLSLQTSEVGNGSTFTFSVSAGTFEGDLVMDTKSLSGPALAPAIDISNDHEIFSGKRVLIIEDSEDNQLLISRYLLAVGIKVEVASNGFEGIAKMQNAEYDLVVLDIQMPGMDGHQVARKLRDNGFDQPIIALTAHAFKEDRERAFRSGFNEYLTKPINRAVLLKTLSNRLCAPALH